MDVQIQMEEKSGQDALEQKIRRGHFSRAVFTAERMDLPEQEIRRLGRKALGQMSVIYRNAPGTKHLAGQYGFSRQEVKEALEEFADEMKKEGNSKVLEPCYDYRTGKYLSFQEWMNHYMKIWDKIL